MSAWGLPSCGQVQSLVAEFAGVEEVSRGGPVALARLPDLVGGAWCFVVGGLWEGGV